MTKSSLLLVALLTGTGVSTLSATPKHTAAPSTVATAATAPLPLAGQNGREQRVPGPPLPPAAHTSENYRTSANYSLVAESFDAGGAVQLASASYTVKDTSAGGVGALGTSANYTAKGGYAGQLYEAVGLSTSNSPKTVDENATRQLGAGLLLDDRSQLALSPDSVEWTVVTGPVRFPAATSGLAAADSVYQNTSATIRAAYAGYTADLVLTVFNVNLDDYGAYAGDGIDDAWQVSYFGLENPLAAPNVDADGTGQNNLFKYLAGLDPLDPNSRFALSIRPVPGQPAQKALTFSPRHDGRTYTVQSTAGLTPPDWTPLTGYTSSDDGALRTVTDLNAGPGAERFYRVQISLP